MGHVYPKLRHYPVGYQTSIQVKTVPEISLIVRYLLLEFRSCVSKQNVIVTSLASSQCSMPSKRGHICRVEVANTETGKVFLTKDVCGGACADNEMCELDRTFPHQSSCSNLPKLVSLSISLM